MQYLHESKIRGKRHDKTILLLKTKPSTIEDLTSRTLIDCYINHDEFLSVNNLLKKYDEKP